MTELPVCLRMTYFQQRGKFREQINGVAMGSPSSPIVTNLYMEAFEQKAINLATDEPKLWVQYIDNTFVIWQHGQDKLEPYQQHLNSLQDPIQFTMKVEDSQQLPFLDVLVKREGNSITKQSTARNTQTVTSTTTCTNTPNSRQALSCA